MIIICPSCGSINEDKNLNCKEQLCSYELLLNKKYYLIKVLGENIGITYLAYDFHKKINVVIKELPFGILRDWKTKELFTREVNTLSKLNHQSIPKLIEEFSLGFGKNNRIYLVMEYIDGINLKEEMKTKRYRTEEILDILKQVVHILNYLHSLNPKVIHRDLKLSNLIRKKSGSIVLIDFGSVADILKSKEGTTITGTFGYMAPEQLLGKSSVKSDYYSLGMIAAVLLSRREPEDMFDGISLNWKAHISIDSKVNYLLENLLAESINKRISSAVEIINLIDKIEKNELNIDKKKNNLDRSKIKSIKNNKGESLEIIFCAKSNLWDSVLELIDHGANINTTGLFGENLLHYAILNNNEEITKILLNYKINVNNLNKNKQTPLMLAIEQQRYNIIDILIKENINWSILMNDNKTYLMLIAKIGYEQLFFKVFKENKHLLNSIDKQGNNVLSFAYMRENINIINFLIESGISLNQKFLSGETILMKAILDKKVELAKKIIDYKADLELQSLRYETAFFIAVKTKQYEIIKHLIKNDSNINCQNKLGYTPLMLMVENQDIEMIKFLLKNNANKFIKNKSLETAFELTKDLEIIKLLK